MPVSQNDPMFRQLQDLRRTKQARDEEQFRLNQAPLMPGQAPRSTFMGERDYTNALNEDGQLADLESLFGGNGLTTKVGRYPSAGVPGLRAGRPSAGSLSLSEDYDPEYDQRMKTLQEQRANAENTSLDLANRGAQFGLDTARQHENEDAVTRSLQRGPDFELGTGRAGIRAGQMGDIQNAAQLQGARGAATTFMDPTVRAGRKEQLGEQEELIDARYGKDAELAAKLEAERIRALARTNAANITQGGGLQREAIRSLLKLRETAQMFGGKPPTDDQLDTLLQGYAQPGEPPPDPSTLDASDTIQASGVDDASLQALIAGAANGGPGADQLAQHWDQLTPQQQALVRQRLGRR